MRAIRVALAGIAGAAAICAGAGAQPQAKAPSVTVAVPAAGSVNFARLVVKAKSAQRKLPSLKAVKEGAGSPTVVGSVRRRQGTKDTFVVAVTIVGAAARTTEAAGGAPKVTVSVQGAGPLTVTGRPVVVADTLVFEERPPGFCADEFPPGSVRDAASALVLLLGTEEDRRFVRDWHRLGLLGACDLPADPAPAERIGALACKFTLTKTAPGAGAFEGQCSKETSSVTFGDVLAAVFESAASGDTSCDVAEILKRAHVICAGRTAAASGPFRVQVTWRGADPRRPWVAASGVARPGEPAPSIGPFAVSRIGF